MRLPIITKRRQAKRQLTLHDEFHKYTEDLHDLTKLREKAMQKMVLQNSPQSREEVARYDVMIAIAQKAIVSISEQTN